MNPNSLIHLTYFKRKVYNYHAGLRDNAWFLVIKYIKEDVTNASMRENVITEI